jgi:hypothetical protein
MFQDKYWPMSDSSCPRLGWRYDEYMKHATVAGKDEHGAIFFHVRDLLKKFCTRVQNLKLSFSMFRTNAVELETYLPDTKFDRIEACTLSFSPPYAPLSNLDSLLRSPTSATAATSAQSYAFISSRPFSSPPQQTHMPPSSSSSSTPQLNNTIYLKAPLHGSLISNSPSRV